jgi:putative intracellular protease/amidase
VLDLTGPLTVFWSASAFVKQQGRHGYARHTVCLDGGPIVTSEGVTIETLPLAEFEGAAIDTIVVPGALVMEPTLSNRRLLDWLAVDAPKARRTASVCAGAFLLAEAGLLSAIERGGLGKALSIVARRDCQYSEERTTHLLFAAEAGTFRDSFDSVVRFLKPATRCVNSDRFHRLRGGAAALRCIDPCEVSGAHVHTVRKSIDAEVALQMLHYPAFQFAE